MFSSSMSAFLNSSSFIENNLETFGKHQEINQTLKTDCNKIVLCIKKKVKHCEICGRTRQDNYLRRYGGDCCNACARFFMRFSSIKTKLICKNFNLCLKTPTPMGTFCRKCRFQKCLEIGMRCNEAIKSINYDTLESGEYLNFAKTLHKLFIVCFNQPDLFYDFIKNPKLLVEALKALISSETEITINFPNYIQSWALLLRDNEIPFNSILFYSIIFHLRLPWLPDFQQKYIKELQINAINKSLMPVLEVNEKFQQTILKLTEFFSSKFLTLYCSENFK